MTAPDTAEVGLHLALLVGAGMSFIVFELAATHFFRCPAEPVPLRLRGHRVACAATAALHLGLISLARQTPEAAMIGALGLYLGGLALFLWAQESIKLRPPADVFSGLQPDSLETGGPFAVVRHPFYLSYTMIWWAGVVATGSLWAIGSAVGLTVLYIVAAHEEERAFAETSLADAYGFYAARTSPSMSRLLPFDVDWSIVKQVTRAGAATALVVLTTILALHFSDPGV